MNKSEDISMLVLSSANVEHVTELNGNATKYTGKTLRQYRDGKVYLGDEEIEVSASSFASPYVYKYVIDLTEKPIVWDQIFDLNPNLRMTKGMYMIKYTPVSSKDCRKGRPFKIGQDLIRWDIRVAGTKHWQALTEKIPELRWLARNSTLTNSMFGLAKKHPGMSLWFTIKWDEYEAKLKAQETYKYSDRPFISHKTSVKDYKDKFKSMDRAMMLRTFSDVLREINEVEALDTVQKEMREETGEGFDRSRKCQHDPVTGRFIRKEKKEE